MKPTATPLPHGPSPGALWSLLWRAVLFFPLGVLLTALHIAIPGTGLVLLFRAITFALMSEWWSAAAHLAGLPIVVLSWRIYARWAAQPPITANERAGFLL